MSMTFPFFWSRFYCWFCGFNVFFLSILFSQLILLAAVVAMARAGGPAAYSISAISGDHAYVGHQQEHTVKVRIPHRNNPKT